MYDDRRPLFSRREAQRVAFLLPEAVPIDGNEMPDKLLLLRQMPQRVFGDLTLWLPLIDLQVHACDLLAAIGWVDVDPKRPYCPLVDHVSSSFM